VLFKAIVREHCYGKITLPQLKKSRLSFFLGPAMLFVFLALRSARRWAGGRGMTLGPRPVLPGGLGRAALEGAAKYSSSTRRPVATEHEQRRRQRDAAPNGRHAARRP
jgi:hypothetical protein